MTTPTTSLRNLSRFLGIAQTSALRSLIAGEESAFFIAKLEELAQLVDTMPRTYDTDGQGDKAVAQLHYFTANADFYITERDREERQLQAFGLVDLGFGPELGYISLEEILRCGAELDLHFEPRTLGEIRGKAAA